MDKQTEFDRPGAQSAKAGLWLAIETTGFHGTVALAEVDATGCRVVAASNLASDRRSAQTLAPGIAELLAEQDADASDVAAVAVAVGPGSFTGLRVGVVTAKAFAYATGAAPIGVDALDALAAGTDADERFARLWTVLDAHRDELFCARFDRGQDNWRRAGPNERLSRDRLAQALAPSDLLVGPIADRIDHTNTRVQAPKAEGVARVAWERWRAGAADDPFALAPRYHRPSAAEEKADSTHAAE